MVNFFTDQISYIDETVYNLINYGRPPPLFYGGIRYISKPTNEYINENIVYPTSSYVEKKYDQIKTDVTNIYNNISEYFYLFLLFGSLIVLKITLK